MQTKPSSKKKSRGYTPVDNFLLDVVMPLSSQKNPKYFPVLLTLVRRTVGWRKRKDWVSLSQFQKGSGVGRHTVIEALRFWEQAGLVRSDRKQTGIRGSVAWELIHDYDKEAVTSAMAALVERPDWCSQRHSTSAMADTPLVQPLHTRKKVIERKSEKEKGTASPSSAPTKKMEKAEENPLALAWLALGFSAPQGPPALRAFVAERVAAARLDSSDPYEVVKLWSSARGEYNGPIPRFILSRLEEAVESVPGGEFPMHWGCSCGDSNVDEKPCTSCGKQSPRLGRMAKRVAAWWAARRAQAGLAQRPEAVSTGTQPRFTGRELPVSKSRSEGAVVHERICGEG